METLSAQGITCVQFNLTPQFDFNGDGRIDTADSVVVGGSTIGYAARKVEGKGLLTAPSVSGNVRFVPSSGVKKTEDMTKTALVDSDANNSGRISWEDLTPREVTAPTTPMVTTDTETATLRLPLPLSPLLLRLPLPPLLLALPGLLLTLLRRVIKPF